MTADVPLPRVAPVPGAKRARHKRWTRIATVVTVVALVAFVVALGVLLFGSDETEEEPLVTGCRTFLDGIADQVKRFAKEKGHLPARIQDLGGPAAGSPYDVEPWDCWGHPFEYRVVDEEKRTFRIRSYGADGTPDTPDDVVWPDGVPWR